MNSVHYETHCLSDRQSVCALLLSASLKALCALVKIVLPDFFPGLGGFFGCSVDVLTVQRLSTRGCCASEGVKPLCCVYKA